MACPRPDFPLHTDSPAARVWPVVCALLTAILAGLGSAAAQRFSAPTVITTGNRPSTVLAADFTARGLPELLALDAGAIPAAASVRVLPNAGGAFSVGSAVATAGAAILAMPSHPGALPDLYWVNVSGNTATLERASGQVGGGYTPGTVVTSFPLAGSATPRLLLAAGGLHVGYGTAVLVADAANNQLYTVLPNPDGTYAIQPVYGYPGLPLIAGASQLLSADINGDGLPDLLVAGAAGVQVFLAYGNGSNLFTGYGASTTYPCTGTVGSIAVADMDADGHPDLLVEGANGRIDIYHGNEDGTFAAASEVGTGTGADNAAIGNGGHLVSVADLDGDGLPDLVLANPLGITVLLGTGGRSFQLSGTYDTGVTAAGSSPTSFVFTDLNGDGKPDLAFDSPQGVTLLYAESFVTLTGQVTASPEPSLYGSDMQLTLQLTTPSTGPAPTGTVTFSVDGAVAGTATMASGQASYTVAAPEYLVGKHTIDASYSGDSVYAAADFTGTHTVQGLPSVTTISDLVTPIYYGQEIGYTNGIDAVVIASAADPGAPPAGATLDGGLTYVYLDGQLVCSLLQGGTAPSGGPQRCNDAAFEGYQAGTHTLLAVYQGNGYYAPSTSVTYPVIVLPDDTTLALATSGTPSALGQPVTFTATMAAPYATPTGPVTFLDGAAVIGSGTLNANGIAQFTTSALALGPHAITASYIATRNFNASQSGLTQVVQAVSATTLTSSLNPSMFGDSVTFTAAVSIGGVSAGAAGGISFTDGNTLLQVLPINAQGVSTFTTSSLAVGQHLITATFTPANPTNTLFSSASLTQVVTVATGNDFTLTINPNDLEIGVGNTGNVTVTVTDLAHFNEAINLTCSGLPQEATCTFLTSTIPAGGGSTQLAIHPEAPHDCGSMQQYFIAGVGGRVAIVLAAATAFLLGLRRRRFRAALFAAVLCVLPMLSGCGLGGHCTDLGTRPGSYTFTVIGTSVNTGITHAQTVHIKAFIYGDQ